MRNTLSLSITLPHDMAQMVEDKVASGAYASESEVIRDGLRAPCKHGMPLSNAGFTNLSYLYSIV
jgi:metal-responsive CopG/Arc/MetJ family transcriptional regulator